MPASTYLPSREPELVTWANNFNSHLAGSGATFGLDPTQVATFSVLHSAFVTAYNAANDPVTRSPSTIVTKNDAKDAMINSAGGIRKLVTIIQANPGTTDTARANLNITIRDDEPTPIPVPAFEPVIDITKVYGWSVSIRLHDLNSPTSRAKPEGVYGATILSYVGDSPPADPADYKFEGSTTKTTYTIDFPITVPAGTKVWITAFWTNPRNEAGPAATPISTYTNHSGLAAA